MKASHQRRVTTLSATGSTSSHRVHLTLTLTVTKVTYSALTSAPSTSSSDQPDLSTLPTASTSSSTTTSSGGGGGTATLQISGKVTSENPHVKKGAFHTLDLEVGRDFTIVKQVGEWDSVMRERIREMTELGRGAEVGAILCGDGMLLTLLASYFSRGWDTDETY